MKSRTMTFAGGFLLGVAQLFGQAPSGERIPITDPDRLESLGLPRDATNVYQWSKLGAAVQAPETWGTAIGVTTVAGHELVSEGISGLTRRPEAVYCWAGEEYPGTQRGLAQLKLPDGVALHTLQFWTYDDHPVYGLAFEVYEYCRGVGFDPPIATLIGSGDTPGATGYYLGSAALNGYTVNNKDCAYSVRVIFMPANLQCVGEQLQLFKLQASWVRQVSPAPAAASFSDVPAGHPFFQFVEALAKSGITGGCGNGSFCPDQPLTRGQMAVFLAKGLGLAWP